MKLPVLDWLAAQGHREMHLAGKGWGALAAAFAAVLHDRVTHVTLKQGLKSFAEVAESETYNWPLSALPPNILARFDLTDCYRELAKSKNLRQIDPQGSTAQFS